LAALCLPTPAGRALRGTLFELAIFCEQFGCDVDLRGWDNWMLDADGALRLSDPVISKAYEF
jgi:hypothetical protein